MRVFRLNHVLNASQQIVAKINKDGKTFHKLIRVEKGKTYKVGDYDEESLKERTTETRYTKEIENYLISEGVEYEVILCKTCGGKKKKVKVKTVELFDVDEAEYEEVQ